jgi:hypothetical protein
MEVEKLWRGKRIVLSEYLATDAHRPKRQEFWTGCPGCPGLDARIASKAYVKGLQGIK